LKQLISSHFKQPESADALKYFIAYKDDENDLVSIFSDEELAEALRQVEDKLHLYLSSFPLDAKRQGFILQVDESINTNAQLNSPSNFFSEKPVEEKIEESVAPQFAIKEIIAEPKIEIQEETIQETIIIEKPVKPQEKPKNSSATAENVQNISTMISQASNTLSSAVFDTISKESNAIAKNTISCAKEVQKKVSQQAGNAIQQFQKTNRVLFEETAQSNIALSEQTANSTASMAKQIVNGQENASKLAENIRHETTKRIEKETVPLVHTASQLIKELTQQNVSNVSDYRKQQKKAVAEEAQKIDEDTKKLDDLASQTLELVNQYSKNIAAKVAHDSKQFENN